MILLLHAHSYDLPVLGKKKKKKSDFSSLGYFFERKKTVTENLIYSPTLPKSL